MDVDKVTPIIVACCLSQQIAFMFPDILSDIEIPTVAVQSEEDSGSNPHPNATLKREYICRNLL